ncbi:MAG: biotin/lipoyl-binding protein [Planctomycetota bacterium]
MRCVSLMDSLASGLHSMDSALPDHLNGPASARSAGDDEVRFLLASIAFGFRLHQHLDPKKVGYLAVNDAVPLTGCDRFTVVLASGLRARVLCITGQERVSRRSETVTRLETLAKHAIALDRAVVYAGDIESVDPLVTPALCDYVENSRVRMIAMLPLRQTSTAQRRRQTKQRIETQSASSGDREIFGLLIAESFGGSPTSSRLPQRCRLIADHVESALAAARQHHKIPLRRPIIWIADSVASIRGRRLLGFLLAMVGLVAITLALLYVPATFRVSCKGILMPASQDRYFAPMDAKVIEVLVNDGQRVEAGDVLLRLTSETLRADIVSAEVSVAENRKLVEALSARMGILSVSGSDKDSIELQSEMAKAEVDLAGAMETLSVLSSRQKELTVRAEGDGIVNGFRLREKLLRRPVNRGDKLLEIVQPDTDWRLELEVEEYRAGPIVEALVDSPDQPLVKYVLATKVNEDRWARLHSIASQVEVSGDGQRYVLHAIATTSLKDVQSEYVGAEVFAKIHAGKRSLGYVLFGDLLDFLRRTIWF